ncbi:MAG: SpoIIE family protein phosphatase [Vicinamibacterales bacterium]
MTDAPPRLLVNDSLGPRVALVERPTFTIGRRPGHHLQLAGAEVSRDHAEITHEDGGWMLRDRGSRYGTFVNGVRVTERVLEHGDRVECGRSGAAFVVMFDGRDGPADATLRDFHQVATLLDALRQLGGHRVVDEVLAMVLDAAIEATGAERGFIMLAGESGELELTLARRAGHVTLTTGTFETSRKVPEQVFTSGQMAVVENLLDDEHAAAHAGTIALGIRHVLCAPLRVVRYVAHSGAESGERSIGVLYLDSRERGRLLSPAARTSIETLAAEAALAIENARLYQQAIEKAQIDRELAVASHIQRALLPEGRRSGPFFETVGASIPTRVIGGDFFEYQELPGGAFGFGIGDITGKGAPAALLAALVQGILAAQALTAAQPDEVMATLNRVLVSRPLESRFVTLFLGALSPDGRLVYCNAGQTPPRLVTADGVSRLEAGGTLVGAFGAAAYERGEVRLADGDTLVLVSDGVTEAMNAAGEQFGEDGVDAVAGDARGRAPQDLLRALLDAVAGFVGGATQHDDLTAVVVRFRRRR